MRYLFAGLAVAAGLTAAPAAADEDLAARFAARPTATSVALSPDGDKLVFIGAYKTGGKAVTVADLKTGDSKVIMAGTSLEFNPYRCGFKSETRLVCTLYGVVNLGEINGGYTRVVAIDTDGTRTKMLSQRPRERTAVTFDGGSIRNWLPDDPHHILMQVDIGYTATIGSLVRAPTEGTGMALVDVDTGTQRLIEPSRNRVVELGADGTGAVRFRGTANADADGYVRDRVAYAVRPKGGKDWVPLTSAALSDARAIEYGGFDATGDHLYQLAPLDGRTALFALATDGTATRTLVYSRDDVDVSGVMRIGKYRRPVGATFSDERGRVHYFDPELASLSASLTRALPGHPDIEIEDESWDGTKKLILADSDSAPGRYYLYDATTRKLGVLVAVYPGLDGVALGTVKAVSYTARDGTRIPAFLTLPPGKTDARGLPGLVMPHGGPSARDTAGFEWLPQFFAAQGFAVLQPNFRGSSGYGEAFFGAATPSIRGALAMGDVNDGGRWLVAQGDRPEKAGDLRLELWRLCRAAGERRRSDRLYRAVGCRRAGNRPRTPADANTSALYAAMATRWSMLNMIGNRADNVVGRGHPRSHAASDRGPGAHLSGRPRPQRRCRTVALRWSSAAEKRGARRSSTSSSRTSTTSSTTARSAPRCWRRARRSSRRRWSEAGSDRRRRRRGAGPCGGGRGRRPRRALRGAAGGNGDRAFPRSATGSLTSARSRAAARRCSSPTSGPGSRRRSSPARRCRSPRSAATSRPRRG